MVEVWRVTNRLDLDPFMALSLLFKLRKEMFGDALDQPLFLHKMGSSTQSSS